MLCIILPFTADPGVLVDFVVLAASGVVGFAGSSSPSRHLAGTPSASCGACALHFGSLPALGRSSATGLSFVCALSARGRPCS